MNITVSLNNNNEDIEITFKSCYNYIRERKNLKYYLAYIAIGNISYSTVLGLRMLLVTDKLNFTPERATFYFLILGLIADLIGILALAKFTPKSTKLAITIKFGLRFVLYVLVAIIGNITIAVIAVACSILVSTMYENKTDAPTINSVDKHMLLAFSNIRLIFTIIGESIGIYICGLLYNYGIQVIFGVSSLFMFFQILLCYKVINLNEKKS